MLDSWGDHPIVKETLAEASDALGEDLGKLIHDGPKETLALTTNTQPVMLVAGIAAYRMWIANGGSTPSVLAGHSLGEYTALVAAGVLSLAQAAPLVRFRAAAMQEAVPVGQGAMAAVLGLDASNVVRVCKEAQEEFSNGEVVEAVNFNDAAQTVIAGSKIAVDRACVLLKVAGAKRTLGLPVSAPFHSSLMKPAAERLKVRLETVTLKSPNIPVVNNIDVAIESDTDRIRDALVRQAFGPVRWVECVQALEAQGIRTVIECGPGKVLTGMVKRIAPALKSASLFDPATLEEVKGLLAS
jgi:[acyl-carrier-protein] S-malonyltransferase